MKDLIKEVAPKVRAQMLAEGYAGIEAYPDVFLTRCLAELSKRAEAVAWMQISVEEGVDTKVPRSNKPAKFNPEWWKFEPLFTFPPIHDIAEIENRTAEACAKVCSEDESGHDSGGYYADLLNSGEWRKYK